MHPSLSSTDIRSCSLCGNENEATNRFCNSCGSPLVRPIETREFSQRVPRYTPAGILVLPPAYTTPVQHPHWQGIMDLFTHEIHCMACGVQAFPGQAFCAICGAPLTREARERIFQPQVAGTVTPSFVSSAYHNTDATLVPLDAWRFSYPGAAMEFAGNQYAIDGITNTMRLDDDPILTHHIQDQIDQGLKDGLLQRGQLHYFCCPWGSEIRVVTRRASGFSVYGHTFHSGESFIYHLSAEDMPEGKPFLRTLIPGPFRKTNDVEFCSPRVEEDEKESNDD